VRRAIARGGLTDEGYCVAEGFHLLEEARRSGCEIPVVLAAESAGAVAGGGGSRVVVLPDRLFQTLSSTVTSQGVIALVRLPAWGIEDVFRGRSLVVVLDGLQDPGNVGAIARAAEAFGATGLMFLKGTASPHHPKTLRASAGSLFRVPFVSAASFAGRPIKVYAAMPFSGLERMAAEADFRLPCAIVIGGEGRGVSAELLAIAEPVAIPTVAVESLNAAVAAAILLYEARKQRV
jgi:RNA methyltransferase, TrmH family